MPNLSPDGVYFRVVGTPQQQGSKTPYGVEQNRERLLPWRALVSDAAAAARGGRSLFAGPVQVVVRFVYTRPKSHRKSNGELRPNAPEYKSSTPDLDKLQRAIGDALTGVLIADDSQIAVWGACKSYGDEAYAEVAVAPITRGDS